MHNLATSLSLSSNDRICSFIWIRGSKHSFLTSFSNFIAIFLFLVFSQHHYSLVSLHLGCVGLRFLILFLYLLYSRYYVVHAPPCFWHTLHVFSKWDAHRNLVPELVPAFFPHSAFLCESFSCERSLGKRESYLFSSKSLNWHFLVGHKPPWSQRSTAWDWNHKGISKLVK